MPPKVVYGKKRPTAKSQTSFTKFLSPDKRNVPTKTAYDILEQRDGFQLEPEHKAQKISNLEEDCGSDVGSLEGALRRLQVQEAATSPLPNAKDERNEGQQNHDKQKKKKKRAVVETVQVDDDLALGLQALSMREHSPNRATNGKSQKARKALGDRDANATKPSKPTSITKPADATKPAAVQEKGSCIEKSSSGRNTLVEVRIPVRNKKIMEKPESRSPLKQRCLQLPTPEALPEPQDVYTEYVSPLLALSDRKGVLSFKEWLAELAPHFKISKIAEASFSEVYRLTALAPTDGQRQESVLKVVALKTPPTIPFPCQQQQRTGEGQDAQLEEEMAEREEKDQFKSHVPDVLSEVKLLQNLNHIPGFTVFRDLTIVQGRSSASLNNAWRSWNKARPRGKKSYFPDPSKKASYDDNQLWAIVEMQDAGTDCEKIMELGGLSSIWEIWDVFWGVCLSIAKAEEACKFEHRDLHLGNICVRSSKSTDDVYQAEVHDPIKAKLHFTRLETTVIDYTLSRAEMVTPSSRRSSSVSCISNTTSGSNSALDEIDVAYLDLNKDPALFEGDASEEYQYEIYRYMRGAAYYNNPLQSALTPLPAPSPAEPKTPRRSPRKNTHIHFDNSDDDATIDKMKTLEVGSSRLDHTSTPADEIEVWKSFHPKTNLVWAHFLLHKMLAHMQACGTTPTLLSAADIMQNVAPTEEDVDPAKVKKKAGKLFKVLTRVSELLCPVALGRREGLSSMTELVVLALEERWLRCADVEG